MIHYLRRNGRLQLINFIANWKAPVLQGPLNYLLCITADSPLVIHQVLILKPNFGRMVFLSWT